MESLYNIQQELINLLDKVEEEEGCISDEEYEQLCIKQEELKTKLYSYVKAIQVWKGDMASCKDEKKRIGDVQKKYENRINNLKSLMLEAVKQFGNEGKTNKFIELPTVRLSTRATTAIEEDKFRIECLLTQFRRLIDELYNNDILCTGDEVDMEGVLNAINANCRAEYGEDFELFTMLDLLSIHVDIVTNSSLYNLFKTNTHALRSIAQSNFDTKLECNTEKNIWKANLTIAEDKGQKITLAKEVINTSLIIK